MHFHTLRALASTYNIQEAPYHTREQRRPRSACNTHILTQCIGTDTPEQTVSTQIRRHRMRRLIRIDTVCHSFNQLSTIQQIIK